MIKVLANYNKSGVWATGDFNYDGVVNADDLIKVLANYNTSLPAPAFVPNVAVPEPSTIIFLGVGAIALIAYGWRRQRKAA